MFMYFMPVRSSIFRYISFIIISFLVSPSIMADVDMPAEEETCSMNESAKAHSDEQAEIIEEVAQAVESDDPLERINMLIERCLAAADHVAKIPVPSVSGLVTGLKDSLSQFACNVAGDIAQKTRDRVTEGLNNSVGPLKIQSSFNDGEEFSLDASGVDILGQIRAKAAETRARLN